jgi:hypothetical protein
LQLTSFVEKASSANQMLLALGPDPESYIGRTVKLRSFFFGENVYGVIQKVIAPPGVPYRGLQETQFAVQRDHTDAPLDIVWGSEMTVIDEPTEDIKNIENKFVKIIRPKKFNEGFTPITGKNKGAYKKEPLANNVRRMQMGYTRECFAQDKTCLVQVLKEQRYAEGNTWKEAYATLPDPRKSGKDGGMIMMEERLPRGDFDVISPQPNYAVLTGAAASFTPGQMVRITKPNTGNPDFDKFITGACANISSPAPGRDRDSWLMIYTYPKILERQIGEFTIEEVTDGTIPDSKKKTCKDLIKEQDKELNTEPIEETHLRLRGEPEPRKDIEYSSMNSLKDKWEDELGELHNLISNKLQPSAVEAITLHNKYVGDIWKMYDGVAHFNSALQHFRDETNVMDQEANDKLRLAYRKGYLEANLSEDTARKFNEYSHWRKQHMLEKHREALEKHYAHNVLQPQLEAPHAEDVRPIVLDDYSGPHKDANGDYKLYYPEVEGNVMYYDRNRRDTGKDDNLKRLKDIFGDYNFQDPVCNSVTDLQKLIAQFGAIVTHLVKMMEVAKTRKDAINKYLTGEGGNAGEFSASSHTDRPEMQAKFDGILQQFVNGHHQYSNALDPMPQEVRMEEETTQACEEGDECNCQDASASHARKTCEARSKALGKALTCKAFFSHRSGYSYKCVTDRMKLREPVVCKKGNEPDECNCNDENSGELQSCGRGACQAVYSHGSGYSYKCVA